MPRKVLKCTRCAEEITGVHAWTELNGVNPTGLCQACLSDSFGCPRCGRWMPKADNRGSYCRQCRSAYNKAYAAQRRGKA